MWRDTRVGEETVNRFIVGGVAPRDTFHYITAESLFPPRGKRGDSSNGREPRRVSFWPRGLFHLAGDEGFFT